MSKMSNYILEQVELVEGEFRTMDTEQLFDRVWTQLIKIGLNEYNNMNQEDKFDSLVDGIIEQLLS